jgi:hypothetical protein
MNLNDACNKTFHLEYFRERGRETLVDLQREIGTSNHKKLASSINKASQESARTVLKSILSMATKSNWSDTARVEAILTSTYASYIAMLELRNEVWPYEYMAFSRRIGELWEGFIRNVFDYAPSGLTYFIPPLFAAVRTSLKQEITEYIAMLPLDDSHKTELIDYYNKVWLLVDSGEINLELDLHFELAGKKSNIDLKSGFGSNEKGNTNRLLMVATIYQNLDPSYSNYLLVRAPEDRNNHYFRTLRDCGVWQAFCGEEAYLQMYEFTGFDIKSWVNVNIDWRSDLDENTVRHFQESELLSYLEW